MQVLHASLLLQPSVQLQYFRARLAGVTAEIPPTWQVAVWPVGCNTKILAEIFDEPASPCNNLQFLHASLLFYFIAARPYNCNKIK